MDDRIFSKLAGMMFDKRLEAASTISNLHGRDGYRLPMEWIGHKVWHGMDGFVG